MLCLASAHADARAQEDADDSKASKAAKEADELASVLEYWRTVDISGIRQTLDEQALSCDFPAPNLAHA